MKETAEDVARLQRLLDDSHAAMGSHAAGIITSARRLSAAELCARLQGMCLLTVATVTADCRPLAGPVDGLFYRGQWWFGTGREALRLRHLRARPAISATHVPGEHFAVTVHGDGQIVDVMAPELAGFRELCVEVYGPQWQEWRAEDEAPYVRITARRMLTFAMDQPGHGS